jgi:hypothetical protein
LDLPRAGGGGRAAAAVARWAGRPEGVQLGGRGRQGASPRQRGCAPGSWEGKRPLLAPPGPAECPARGICARRTPPAASCTGCPASYGCTCPRLPAGRMGRWPWTRCDGRHHMPWSAPSPGHALPPLDGCAAGAPAACLRHCVGSWLRFGGISRPWRVQRTRYSSSRLHATVRLQCTASTASSSFAHVSRSKFSGNLGCSVVGLWPHMASRCALGARQGPQSSRGGMQEPHRATGRPQKPQWSRSRFRGLITSFLAPAAPLALPFSVAMMAASLDQLHARLYALRRYKAYYCAPSGLRA